VARKPRSKTATRRSGSRSGGGKRSPPPARETAHQRRIRLYLEKHPGATKAQARGHKPAEHRTRKERARLAGKFDENQRASVKRFAGRQFKRNRDGPDPDELYRLMLEKYQSKPRGWQRFEIDKGQVARHAKMRRHRNRVRSVDKAGKVKTIEMAPERVWEDFEDYAEEHDIPEEWLWYH
jgi:hypothetical protein